MSLVGGGIVLSHEALHSDYQAVPQGHAIAAGASNIKEPGTGLELGDQTPRETDRTDDRVPQRVDDRRPGQVPDDPSVPDSTSRDDTEPDSPNTPDDPDTPTDPQPPQPPVPPQPPLPPQPPEPPQPPVPPTPAPLGFTGISENTTVNLLGIRVLSSYTLALSGEPGQTATVWYGSSRAGAVTFDGSGRTSITLGGSLINLGLGNPLIRAAYSDGTGEIQAHRNSI